MRKWIDLFEGYHTTVVLFNITFEVFKNPSRMETMKLVKGSYYGYLRANLILNGDELFVWDGEREDSFIEHMEMAEKLRREPDLRLFLREDSVTYYKDDFYKKGFDIEKALRSSIALRRIYGKDFAIIAD